MDDAQFRKLLDYLEYSWAGYRKVRKGVKKRISRHMYRLGCPDMASYLNMLKQQADLRTECELLMTVSISRFFRDRRLWQMLELRWLPDIIAESPLKIAVWSAGCACGEEAYSLVIVWERLKARHQTMPRLEILATDRHPQYIERAKGGIYNPSSLRELGPDVRTGFFDSRKGSKQFLIKDEFKNDIRWEIGHLLNEPSGSDFNIIFLRNNILTYYRREAQICTLKSMINCLIPGGLFIIGCHESLPLKTGELVQMSNCPYVFQKI